MDMYKTALAILLNDQDVADAIQDTILICWKKIHTLKVNKYFKTWLIRILINNCYVILNDKRSLTDLASASEVYSSDEYNLELKETLKSLDENIVL